MVVKLSLLSALPWTVKEENSALGRHSGREKKRKVKHGGGSCSVACSGNL